MLLLPPADRLVRAALEKTTLTGLLSEANVILLTLVAYKVLMICVGLWATSRNKNEADFFLGGRGLGPFVAGLSYAASTSSAWVILGFSGFVFTIGLSALWMVPGIWAGYAVVWLYFGRRLREESRTYNQVTLTDFMLQDASPKARAKGPATALAAVLVVFCFVFYVAAQLDAAGSALSANFGMSVPAAIILGAVIVVFYSLLGGFWAVSVTDMVQAAIMMVVSVGVPVAALVAAGGPAEVWSTLDASMPADFLRIDGGHASLVFLGFVVGLVGMSLGTLGQPHLLSRLMAVRGEAERRQGFLITLGWGIVVFAGMVTLGLSGRALMPDLAMPETLFYKATSSYLPAIVAGIATAAVLSAVMSTVDSLLLAASAAVAHDMGVNRRLPGREAMASRASMLAVAILAVALALNLPDTIFNRVLFAWSALGAAFGPLVLFRVAGREVGANSALAVMATGFATTVLFYTFGAMPVTESLLSQAAHLPGDPFERVVPWIPGVVILLLATKTATVSDADAIKP